jgi:hypothetical protein
MTTTRLVISDDDDKYAAPAWGPTVATTHQPIDGRRFPTRVSWASESTLCSYAPAPKPDVFAANTAWWNDPDSGRADVVDSWRGYSRDAIAEENPLSAEFLPEINRHVLTIDSQEAHHSTFDFDVGPGGDDLRGRLLRQAFVREMRSEKLGQLARDLATAGKHHGIQRFYLMMVCRTVAQARAIIAAVEPMCLWDLVHTGGATAARLPVTIECGPTGMLYVHTQVFGVTREQFGEDEAPAEFPILTIASREFPETGDAVPPSFESPITSGKIVDIPQSSMKGAEMTRAILERVLAACVKHP